MYSKFLTEQVETIQNQIEQVRSGLTVNRSTKLPWSFCIHMCCIHVSNILMLVRGVSPEIEALTPQTMSSCCTAQRRESRKAWAKAEVEALTEQLIKTCQGDNGVPYCRHAAPN